MKKIIIAMSVICAAALAYYGIKTHINNAKYNQPGFAYGNGRLEATEVSISTKLAGKIAEIYVNEGELVRKGDKLALMQLNVLNAELSQAQAELKRANAELRQKQTGCDNAKRRFERHKQMLKSQATSEQSYDDAKANYLSAQADLEAAAAAVEIAKAKISRTREDINDSLLTSPIRGRVQYRVAQPGEVLNTGNGILNLVDLTDVYMTFFLPEEIAGKVKIGAESRIVLDAIPDIPIPATISFVADVAQFTPKTVETREERQKLMFRIKAKIDPVLLEQHIQYIKTGLPGEAWVKINPDAKWPEFLMLKRERDEKAK